MKLTDLAAHIDLQIDSGSGGRWAVLGPEVETDEFRTKLASTKLLEQSESNPDNLILVGAMSAQSAPLAWLAEITQSLNKGDRVIVIDWQYDGPPDVGPPLERRFRKGKVRRWFRENGFGVVTTLANQPLLYVVKAVKGPAPAVPHAGDFVAVATVAELPKNTLKRVELFGQPVVVANTGKEIVAFALACPHAGKPLDNGLLRGRNIVCRAHHYIWNVCSGEPVEPSDEDILPRYAVEVDQNTGQILVALAAST
jgi:toluene monooxygenase system ferredoxin subunit